MYELETTVMNIPRRSYIKIRRYVYRHTQQMLLYPDPIFQKGFEYQRLFTKQLGCICIATKRAG